MYAVNKLKLEPESRLDPQIISLIPINTIHSTKIYNQFLNKTFVLSSIKTECKFKLWKMEEFWLQLVIYNESVAVSSPPSSWILIMERNNNNEKVNYT